MPALTQAENEGNSHYGASFPSMITVQGRFRSPARTPVSRGEGLAPARSLPQQPPSYGIALGLAWRSGVLLAPPARTIPPCKRDACSAAPSCWADAALCKKLAGHADPKITLGLATPACGSDGYGPA